jgi:ribosomal protein S18 acetylase RimI-like enzyme
MPLTVRKAKPGDAPALAKLLWEMSRETYSEFKDLCYKPIPKKEFLKVARATFKNRIKDRKHFMLIAVQEEPIGFAACRIDRYRPSLYAIGSYLYVEWLFVEKEHRRRKVATKLMEEASKEAKKRKIKRVSLETQTTSKRNLRFYESLGFEKKHYKLFKVVK